MRDDCKNWKPFYMIVLLSIGTIVSLSMFIVFGVLSIGVGGILRWVLFAIFLVLLLGFMKSLELSIVAHLASSDKGKK